jgi:hypothetical protein
METISVLKLSIERNAQYLQRILNERRNLTFEIHEAPGFEICLGERFSVVKNVTKVYYRIKRNNLKNKIEKNSFHVERIECPLEVIKMESFSMLSVKESLFCLKTKFSSELPIIQNIINIENYALINRVRENENLEIKKEVFFLN